MVSAMGEREDKTYPSTVPDITPQVLASLCAFIKFETYVAIAFTLSATMEPAPRMATCSSMVRRLSRLSLRQLVSKVNERRRTGSDATRI